MRIGYLGLGNMGGALARLLLLTHPIHVRDLDPQAVHRLAESGATPHPTPAALALYRDAIAERGEAAEINTAALVVDRQSGTRMVPPNPKLA